MNLPKPAAFPMRLQSYTDIVRLHLSDLLMGAAGALAVLIGGFIVARLAGSAARAALARSPIGSRGLLVNFLEKAVRMTVMVVAGVIALGQVGVEIGPLIAGIGITGFVVGFAFKDSLSNFAAGLLLLFYQPFDLDDVVEISGQTGRVVEMSVVATELRLEDGRRAIIPNSKIWNGPIINHNGITTGEPG